MLESCQSSLHSYPDYGETFDQVTRRHVAKGTHGRSYRWENLMLRITLRLMLA
jgi:hypothetical protein